jgi:hypothetical protein
MSMQTSGSAPPRIGKTTGTKQPATKATSKPKPPTRQGLINRGR